MVINILVIDDEPKWINFTQGKLGTSFEIDVAADRTAAMVKLKEKYFDLIIASSRRLDLLKIIGEQYPAERVVVATGQPTTREAIETYRLGALDYFAKDFRPEKVSKKILEAIEKPAKVPA